jgi:hypothetical protein
MQDERGCADRLLGKLLNIFILYESNLLEEAPKKINGAWIVESQLSLVIQVVAL